MGLCFALLQDGAERSGRRDAARGVAVLRDIISIF